MAATFSSPSIPSLLLAPGLLALPLLAWKRAARRLRGRLASITRGDSRLLEIDPTAWVDYSLSWSQSGVTFSAGGRTVFETNITPQGPLGLVIWIDNQFAAWKPEGTISFGVLAGGRTTMDIEELQIRES